MCSHLTWTGPVLVTQHHETIKNKNKADTKQRKGSVNINKVYFRPKNFTGIKNIVFLITKEAIYQEDTIFKTKNVVTQSHRMILNNTPWYIICRNVGDKTPLDWCYL